MTREAVTLHAVWVLMALVALGLAPPALGAGEGKLVLDESAYWRYYIQFGVDRLCPQALRREGEKVLGEAGMKLLSRQARRSGRVPAGEDWRDHAFVVFSAGQGDSRRAAWHCASPPPPAGWTRPDFPDGSWSRQRLPLMVGNFLRGANMHGDKDMQQLRVRRAHFRTSFAAADPAGGEVVLEMAFRGGARVWLNGEEISRAAVPAGAGEADAPADPYPSEAYVCQADEVPAYFRQRERKLYGIHYCEDLPGRFDDAAAPRPRWPRLTDAERAQPWWNSCGRSGFAGYFGGWTSINRKGFERITKLRNRRLGPVRLPKRLLRAGANVLAVEVRAADIHPVAMFSKPGTRYRGGNWGEGFQRVMYWSHCRLLELELRGGDAAAASALARPAGREAMHVWVEDVHRRCYSPDFGPGGPAGTVRFVGAVGGTYGAQVVVTGNKALTALKAVPSALTGPGGAALPASAVGVSYFVGHPADQLVKLGQIRNTAEDRKDPLCPPAEQAVIRFGGPDARRGRLPRKKRLDILRQIRFFDHLTPAPPEQVPADSCQPIWLSLRIPPQTPPGRYSGSVTISAAGARATVLPVTAEVVGWRVPDARHFQTFMGLEQSPYGVARQYQVPLWSEEHFRLLEGSFRQLARTGNDMVFVPVLQHMEFGNFEDAPVRWLRRADGSLGFDYRILDRYLDAAVRHLGVPRVLCICVMHGADRFGPGNLKATVPLLDEATGKTETLELGPDSPHYRSNWKAFATGLHGHLKALGRRPELAGLERSMYWGFGWDGVADPQLPALLAGFLPAVQWARGSHGGRPGGAWGCVSNSIGPFLTETSVMGWKNRLIYLLCPRTGSTILSSNGHSPPFAYRVMVDRALVAGLCGIGRLGADYWADIYFQGYKGSLSGGIAGMPCSNLLHPGCGDRAGAESSARYEALLEGIQEAEARIFLEQAIDRKRLPADLARRAADVLSRHNRETLFISPGRVGVQVQEYSSGWQDRSRRLYAAAAEAGGGVGLDADPLKIDARLPARAAAPVALTLRNWTVRPRAWKAAADRPWLVLAKTSGLAEGHVRLPLTVDTSRLTPGAAATGKVTITDVDAGRSMTVEVAARVGEVFDLVMPAYDTLGAPGHAACWKPRRIGDRAFFNVTPGGSDSGEHALVNLSGSELSWKIRSSAEWLTAAPASGRLPAGGQAFVKLTAGPADREAVTRPATLTVSDAEGATLARPVTVRVIPAYRRAALPAGEAVELKDVPKSRVKLHKSRTYWLGTSSRGRRDYGPRFGANPQVHVAGAKAAATTMHASTEQVTVYDVAGAGFEAFSARVWIPSAYRKPSRTGTHRVRVNFEIHVDGRPAAQSGLMTPADEARLLVVGGLAGAKEVRLVTRFDRPDAKNLGRAVYVQWQQPRFYKGK